jgi:hypothetical protein
LSANAFAIPASLRIWARVDTIRERRTLTVIIANLKGQGKPHLPPKKGSAAGRVDPTGANLPRPPIQIRQKFGARNHASLTAFSR